MVFSPRYPTPSIHDVIASLVVVSCAKNEQLNDL